MNPNDFDCWDWRRILLGNAPLEFLLEATVRTIIMYSLLLIVLRLLGKRMSGQITIAELSVMLMLGAIISVPMETVDRGLLPGILLLFLVMFWQRGGGMLTFYSDRFRHILQGKTTALVMDGVLQQKELNREGISHSQLFAHLRSQNICQLGEIERVYLEPHGGLSVFLAKKAKPGLSIFPNSDDRLFKDRESANVQICATCGSEGNAESETSECCCCSKLGKTIGIL